MREINGTRALEIWREAGLLDPPKVEELKRYLGEREPTEKSSRGITVFASIGAVLIGLGLILFVASHWAGMGPLARFVTLLLTYGLIVAVALVTEKHRLENVASAVWFLATLSLGANIFLLGQIFHFSLTFWQGPFLWMVGTLAMGYATQSRLHAWLAIPLAILTLGWIGSATGWSFDDQIEFLISSDGLGPLFPLVGLGLVSLAFLTRRNEHWQFATLTWMVWGALLVAVPLVLSTIHPKIYDRLFEIDLAVTQWLTIAGLAALIGLAMGFGMFRSQRDRALLLIIANFVSVLLVQGAHDASWLASILRGRIPFFVYGLCVFGISLLVIWSGLQAANRHIVNVGVGAASVIILVQYFSWTFRLLDRSVAFVLGGIVLIAMTIFIENKRRQWLARIAV